MDIGIRVLRDGLSRHLATVREGYTITVTDHGRPVARILPVDVPTKLEQLIAAHAQSKTTGTVADLVERQRG